MADGTQEVRRRRVFYIPGYDPIHPRRYRELYRKEGAAQAGITGYDLTLRPKTTKGPYGWHVDARIDPTARLGCMVTDQAVHREPQLGAGGRRTLGVPLHRGFTCSHTTIV